MVAFIDELRERFGVEPICGLLREPDVKIAPSIYSARAVRDTELKVEIRTWPGRVGDGGVQLASCRHRLHAIVHRRVLRAQCLSMRYPKRLAHNDIVGSVGSEGDSCDNAMIESTNGLCKSELIDGRGLWHGLDDIEFAGPRRRDPHSLRR